ncbi:MAG: ArnT family glycosyltransferase, partial [Pyrinomonadaceae bacterium]
MTRKLRTPLFFLAAFAALLLLHLTLLDLPYYWDEAGYFIPAARDIYADGSFIPHSTLSNAHPPLVMTWIALAWKLLGFHIWVARAAMAGVAALTLTGVYALAERVANRRVALATAVCTALYPVFFAQSTLAHLDMMVAALTMWALVYYLPPRDAAAPLRGDATPSQGDDTSLRRPP